MWISQKVLKIECQKKKKMTFQSNCNDVRGWVRWLRAWNERANQMPLERSDPHIPWQRSKHHSWVPGMSRLMWFHFQMEYCHANNRMITMKPFWYCKAAYHCPLPSSICHQTTELYWALKFEVRKCFFFFLLYSSLPLCLSFFLKINIPSWISNTSIPRVFVLIYTSYKVFAKNKKDHSHSKERGCIIWWDGVISEDGLQSWM